MKKKFCLHCGKEIPPDAGGRQAHRKMYCNHLCKDSATKARQRMRAKGLIPPYKAPVPSAKKKAIVCAICGIEFEGTKDTKYCSDVCRAEAHRRRDGALKAAKSYQRKLAERGGLWGLSEDPWRTGQLPAEIRRNALWA